MKHRIRVLLCDDHTLFREGIKAILKNEPAIAVVGEAEDGRQAIDIAVQLQPDVVLMDLAMPDLSGAEATRRILQGSRKSRVIILTMYEEEEVIHRCLGAGASGYVLKDSPRAQLIRAIDLVNKGGQYLSPRAQKKMAGQSVKGSKRPATGYERLSGREREVLKLLADGLSVKDIATRLVLSVKTVDAHKTNLMRKLDLHDRAGIIKYAVQRGIIRLSAVKTPSDTLS